MTTDAGAIKMFINSLNEQSVSTQGTNFKAVIDETIRAFSEGGVDGDNGNNPTRVLLIASDGEDHEKGVQGTIKKAVDQGIRLFGLGFGSAQGAPIPVRDDRGELRGYKKDDNGQVIMSIPKDEVLANMARDGKGAYYHSTFELTELKNLMGDLDKLEKSDFKTRLSQQYDEKFQIPLLIGLLFGLIDLFFGDRKGNRKWAGRFR
jgi:Ca-activated chloride channel family protein